MFIWFQKVHFYYKNRLRFVLAFNLKSNKLLSIFNGDFDYKEVLFFFSSFYANPFHSSKIHSVFLLYSQLFIYSCSVVSVALKILLKILLIYIDVRVETILFTLGPTVSGPQERKLLHDLITESGYNRLKITL